MTVKLAGVTVLMMLWGCAATRMSRAPQPQTAAPPVSASVPAPPPSVAAPAAETQVPPAAPPSPTWPATPAPAAVPAAHPTARRPATPPATAPAASTESHAATTPAIASPAKVDAAKPGPPELDLGSLEQHLKDTRAIGLFTKLSLKNQVDDLLSEFRAFHQGSSKVPPAELRQKYDLLILKVLSLLQDGDPQLATAVASSRNAIWGILMDPNKFSKI